MSHPFLHQSWLRAGVIALVVCLAGCASLPQPTDNGELQREAMAGTEQPAPAPLALNNQLNPPAQTAGQSKISTGSGRFIRPQALPTPRKRAAGAGAVTFNFENQPVQAVVKAILGDLLKKNYIIAPGVQGNISFSTAEPVDADQALPILETLLAWTGNALVRHGDGYMVVPSKNSVGGNVVPSLGAVAPQNGLQARLFPLQYISATEMKKLIKPFARQDSILLADPARNLLVLSGTPQELANYERTVRTFDVDWLRGMSVGVFSLQRASVGELMPKLDAMFGKNGDTPLAGMLRFIPIERTNALVVISTQPDYLQEVGDWIARIDRGGGNEPQLYVYDVRNIKASDLARYLAQIYANGGGGGGGGSNAGQVGPGLTAGTLGNSDNANGNVGMGSRAGSFGSSGSDNSGFGDSSGRDSGRSGGGMMDSGQSGTAGGGYGGGSAGGFGQNSGLSNTTSSANDQLYSSADGGTRISSVDSSNQLLVRTRPSQWSEIEAAIKRLDTVPLQVQIETRIMEVQLTGQFQFGVQWYLEGLIGGTPNSSGGITPGQPGNQQQWALGKGGMTYNPAGDSFFYSFINNNLQVALHAQEESGNMKTLSAPSLVVLNNQVAHIQAGDQIPVNQTYFTTGLGTTDTNNPTTVGQVQYISTGVILDVQPRINPGGLVYLNIKQQVSVPGNKDQNGNYTIQQREIATQVGVQSGQTVLLGGLIKQDEGASDTGIPGLNRIPLVGRLFGTTSRHRNRSELIVLITPHVIGSSDDAKRITDEYQDKFESLAPLRRHRTESAAPAAPSALPAPREPQASAPPSAGADPAALQQQAEAALQNGDYTAAQSLAMQSWRDGSRKGELCVRNWKVVTAAREKLKDAHGADIARKWQQYCVATP